MASSRTACGADSVTSRLAALVAAQLAREVARGESVTAAVSGGVDSIVLLDLLRRVAGAAGIGLRVLHVNHGLSPNAKLWERFCREHCRRRRVPFQAVRVVVQGDGANVEAQARAARYAAFAASGSDVVALAHNLDDQAETVLLRLLRGAGLRGLSAMSVARALAPASSSIAGEPARRDARLLRPLLNVGRTEIEEYARTRGLHCIQDESNTDERFARNFLRARVIPILEQRFPGARETLARSAAHLDEAAGLLDQLAAADCVPVVDSGRMSVRGLQALGPARAANALRFFLTSRGEPPPSAARTREMLRQLCSGRGDAQPEIRLARASLRRFRGWIELAPAAEVDVQQARIVWRGEPRMVLPGGDELHAVRGFGDGVSAALLKPELVTIRWRRGGERMRLDPQRPTRTLKNLLREAVIPPWQRVRMPLVYCGDALVWAPGIGTACEFRARGRERSLRFAWFEAAEDRKGE